jgi:hypothetical protein
LEELAALKPSFIVIDRTIVNLRGASKAYVQTAPKAIYEATYPVWSLAESALMEALLQRAYQAPCRFPQPFISLDLRGSALSSRDISSSGPQDNERTDINDLAFEALIAIAPPILVDIGASGSLQKQWRALAPFSICIAFDADTRDFQVRESADSEWKSSIR